MVTSKLAAFPEHATVYSTTVVDIYDYDPFLSFLFLAALFVSSLDIEMTASFTHWLVLRPVIFTEIIGTLRIKWTFCCGFVRWTAVQSSGNCDMAGILSPGCDGSRRIAGNLVLLYTTCPGNQPISIHWECRNVPQLHRCDEASAN